MAIWPPNEWFALGSLGEKGEILMLDPTLVTWGNFKTSPGGSNAQSSLRISIVHEQMELDPAKIEKAFLVLFYGMPCPGQRLLFVSALFNHTHPA